MPREIRDQNSIIEIIGRLEIISELLEEQTGKRKYAGDLEVIVYGRDYSNGKRVGPYVRLLVYGPGEEIIREGEWGGNSFYISVEGVLDVYITDAETRRQKKINELQPGTCFGEMSLLAGVARNATIAVPPGAQATVLELTRPALRLLRKLPRFGQAVDATYRQHGLGRVIEDIREASRDAFSPELLAKLGASARFMVYGKHHMLFQEGDPVDKVLFIKSGWVRRLRGVAFDPETTGIVMGAGAQMNIDYLGAGNCLGLEGLGQEGKWQYSAAVMARTEALEIPIGELTADPTLAETVRRAFSDFSTADDETRPRTVSDERTMAAVEEEITTGIVDGDNLLVMDMDLCVRCGNCSLACHKVHGQSRLLRRGIHIERPVKPKGKGLQHLLSPQVCMHCQDPECLTGCPTGAIFRDPLGHVEINPQICIGCFDCATQCPYDAISMTPRSTDPSAPFELTGQLKTLLSEPKQPASHPSTEQTHAANDDMVAIKCNLCENTPLNPQGVAKKAYSCEENCPTGALLRVNPHEYFSEINNTLGIVYRSRAHAIGRNIHKRDTVARWWHIGGTLVTVLLTVVAAWACLRHGMRAHLAGTWLTMHWVTGLAGLVGIVGVMAYAARKQIYRRRAGPLRYWLLAHVYLGIITSVLLFLHSSAQRGGLVPTALTALYAAVLASGLVGLSCYYVVPRVMTSIEGDPLLLEDLLARRAELREALKTTAERGDEQLQGLIEGKVRRRFGSLSYLIGQYVQRVELKALLAQARAEFRAEVEGLDNQEMRPLLLEAVETSATLRRVDALIYLHQLLKAWVAPHVISTSLMLALMVVHVIQVIYFNIR
ncbi:MAG TPA: cyclic nucleotide-binding domain-containing protein [Pyrinomonadaceae bacterium]|jgi:Fe-S-cluster-containing dehydrogenase component/CRP-like cAMP-binding protein